MNRRETLSCLAGALSAPLVAGSRSFAGSAVPKQTKLGIADFAFNIRLRAESSGKKPPTIGDPLRFLEYCHSLGAGGIQSPIRPGDPASAAKLRARADELGMFIEGSTTLPRDEKDVERFENTLRAAKQAGATVVRIYIGGRRYEQFATADEFRAFAERSWKSLQLAEPVAARQGIRLAVENHKDFRVPELTGMLKRLSSEFVGVCVDTGNSIALLEDTTEAVRAYAPYAWSAHLKDLAVAECPDGFLLAETPLGDGILDLAAIIQILREARPEIRFCLESATRDALVVPCLTEKYWATLSDVPARDLARTLRMVRAKAAAKPLLQVSPLSLNEQIALEEKHAQRSLAYAHDRLGL